MIEFRPSRIKDLREGFKLTQDGMARKLKKTTMQTISKWESGESSPTMKSLAMICNTFDVHLTYFFDEVSTTVEENSTN